MLMGKKKNNWQDTDYVLKLFNSKLSIARRRYREYVKKGISEGERPDLIGGGLVRSAGGWDALKGLRKIKAYILHSTPFFAYTAQFLLYDNSKIKHY
jgi:hypothetical protein